MTELTFMFKRSASTFCLILISLATYSQDFLPKIDLIKTAQRDTNNFYFKEIWISSKDINFNDPSGFLRRASDKIDLGYFKEALSDVKKVIKIDSTIGVSYSIRGYLLLKNNSIDSALSDFKRAIVLKDTNVLNFYYAAEILLFLKKYDESASLYMEAIKKDSKFFAAYFGLGNLYFLKSDLKQAEIQYKKVINLKPDFYLAYYNLAILNSILNPSTAIKYLDKCIEVSPSFANAYFLRGYLRQSKNQLQSTLRDLDKAIELDPTNNLFKISRAFLYIHENRFQEGVEELINFLGFSKLQNYVSDFEDSPSAQLAEDFLSQVMTFNLYLHELNEIEKQELIKAICLFSLAKHSQAENIYRDLLHESNTSGLINYLRGFNLEYLNKDELSLKSYSNACKEIKFPYEVYLRQGAVYYKLNDFPMAILSCTNYINKNDSAKLAYRLRAHSYAKIEKYDSAIYDYNRFLKIDSTNLDIYYDRALCYKELENYQNAIKDYSHIIEYKNRDMESIYSLAECKYLSGDTIGAYNFLNQKYFWLGFLNEKGYYLLGSLNLSYMKYDLAIANFDKIIMYNSDHINALVSRGLAYYYKENYEMAKKDLSKALILDNNEIVALYARGLVNIKLNRLDEAFSDFQRADYLGHPNAKKAILIYLKDFKQKNESKK